MQIKSAFPNWTLGCPNFIVDEYYLGYLTLAC